MDFGLAREQELAENVTAPGAIMGTFGSPEQLRGEQTDERSDLFAASVMIYETLHGKNLSRAKPIKRLCSQSVKKSLSGKMSRWQISSSVVWR
ncbi:MAG: hypothetical protein M3Q78_02470 [Acidobacteriota bacterium]|nr:hypothetical protein [Acidobacteriota bacterium]